MQRVIKQEQLQGRVLEVYVSYVGVGEQLSSIIYLFDNHIK